MQGVSCFSYSHALEVLATGSLDHLVRLWTPFTPQQPVAVLTGHSTAVVGLVIADISTQLFSLSQDLVSAASSYGTVVSVVPSSLFHTHFPYTFLPLSFQMLCAWDIHEHSLLQTVSVKFPFTQRLPDFGPSPLVLLLLPHPTLTILCNEYIARYTLGGVQSADAEGAEVSHCHAVCALQYIAVLRQLASASEGGEVKVWEVDTGRCVLKIEHCHGDQELTALVVDSAGRRLLTGAWDGVVKVRREGRGRVGQRDEACEYNASFFRCGSFSLGNACSHWLPWGIQR